MGLGGFWGCGVGLGFWGRGRELGWVGLVCLCGLGVGAVPLLPKAFHSSHWNFVQRCRPAVRVPVAFRSQRASHGNIGFPDPCVDSCFHSCTVSA